MSMLVPVGCHQILEDKCRYLTGSGLRKRWYQQVQYVMSMLVPVGCHQTSEDKCRYLTGSGCRK
jgi:hypothetical protein